jgi:2-polyprenyl-6-hydroxyphenyl methylase/3-demethylubiquinone-9 3-methyltransferase
MSTTTHAIDARSVESHAAEVARGERFEFGENWTRFLTVVDLNRIQQAEQSMAELLGRRDLRGMRFLDIGSGSGLFSLAARRLGAEVLSFDYDPQSVAATAELKRRFAPSDPDWQVGQGSILDEDFVGRLGTFDVVYSWGVLHHTGAMWRALDIAQRLVNEDGLLAVAIYNDRGSQSTRWRHIKRTYTRLPRMLKAPFAVVVSAPEELKNLLRSIATGRPGDYIRTWTQYDTRRGMSHWHDIIDWVGGYPYECARADTIFSFFKQRGFALERLTIGGGLGCSEYVFTRAAGHAPGALTDR